MFFYSIFTREHRAQTATTVNRSKAGPLTYSWPSSTTDTLRDDVALLLLLLPNDDDDDDDDAANGALQTIRRYCSPNPSPSATDDTL